MAKRVVNVTSTFEQAINSRLSRVLTMIGGRAVKIPMKQICHKTYISMIPVKWLVPFWFPII